MPPRARIRPGFLSWSGLALLTGWALLTGAGDGTTPAVTGGLLAGAAAVVVAIAKGLQLVVPVLRGGGGEASGAGVRDLVVEMRAEARADRQLMREATGRMAEAIEGTQDALRMVERAIQDNAHSMASALQGVKENSAGLAAGIRQAIQEQGAK